MAIALAWILLMFLAVFDVIYVRRSDSAYLY